MWMLISRLLQLAAGARANSTALKAVGAGAILADAVNLDWLRQQAIKLAPGSDASALEEAARTAYRMLGLSDDDVLWPRGRDGTPIPPNYFVVDLGKGRAWFQRRYYSRNSVRAARRPRIARPRGVARYR